VGAANAPAAVENLVTRKSAAGIRPNTSCQTCASGGALAYADVPDTLLHLPGSWNFYRCTNPICGSLWLDPRPEGDAVRRAHSTCYSHETARDERGPASRSLSALLRLAVKLFLRASGLTQEAQDISDMHLGELEPGRLLDIGCGDGEFGHRIGQQGWSVDGIDFNAEAARLAEQRYGLKVDICDVEDMSYLDDSFDAVTMHHVIEHLPDPLAVLRDVHRILKPGGSLVIVTPNAGSWGLQLFGRHWQALDPPRHMHIFSLRALEATVRAAGFEDARAYSTASRAWSTFVASIKLAEPSRTGATRPSLRTLARAFALSFREARMNLISGNAGEESVVVARKHAAS
jgi:2-polyprenyl-3-methyl-5-hydroxy-6-metoxy-1,4-benzoquinol methylase